MKRPRPCVRCGSAPRWDGMFVCQKCHEDPVTHQEIEQTRVATDGLDQRHYLVKTFHWVGRWGSRSEV